MKIAIVDDEEKWIKQITEQIKCYDENAEISSFLSGSAFLKERCIYDAVFMDIEIGNENGFEVATQYKCIAPDVILIILTTHSEFSRQGYHIDAFRYLDKLNMEEIEEAISSTKKRLQQEKCIDLVVDTEVKHSLRYRDIIYFEAQGHSVVVVTFKGIFPCKNPMETLVTQLSSDGFYLVHRSYLVNMEYVINCTVKDVVMKNGSVVNMSRRKYKDFKHSLFQWHMERGFG